MATKGRAGMPYLLADWTVVRADGQVERVEKGQWIPERDWDGWWSRGETLPLSYRWREVTIRPGEEPYRLPPQPTPLTDDELEMYLVGLGEDLASVERDNFFYTNFVEQLKQSPDDATADKIIRTMEELGFSSVTWPVAVGGPPPHHSPRPWIGVLKWLMGLMAKAGAIILKIADFISGVLIGGGLGVSAVSVSSGVTGPEIGIEVSPDLYNGRFWLPIRQFLDKVYEKWVQGL
jgi:hypothetical protein